MDEAGRLNELLTELASDPAYATGKKKVPRPVSVDDAVTIAAGLQGEVDQGVEARSVQIAAQGMALACKVGCNGCCQEPIMVFRPEAVAVVRYLRRHEHAAALEAFLAAYPAWKAAVGDTPQKLGDLTADPDRFLAAHVAGWRKQVMCAFNQDGACMIYEVRPITCRGAHAVGTSEHCHGGSPVPAKRVNFVPLERFIDRTRGLLGAAHHAIGGPRGRLEALPNIVHHLLTRR